MMSKNLIFMIDGEAVIELLERCGDLWTQGTVSSLLR